MCGIFAYSGKQNASPILIEGLKRLEYRGYDSWGCAVIDGLEIKITKQTGKISGIDGSHILPHSHTGIAHTRWATHGGITQLNAHPHYATDSSFVLAQNGIVQNYLTLKDDLIQKGYQFISETDTEVIVRLVEETLKNTKDLKEAVRQTMLLLEGRNTIILLTTSGEIIAARNGSPLVLGKDTASEDLYMSSDTLSFAPYAQKMVVINNGEMVRLIDNEIQISEIKSNSPVEYSWEDIDIKSDKVDKEGYDHFMMKEVMESPKTIKQLVLQEKEKFLELAEAIKNASTVYTVGSGTAGAAAAQIAFYLREFGKVNAISLIGADAQEYTELFTDKDLIIAPSQSGETADVLEVLEVAKSKGMKIASYVNMPGAMMTRMSDFKFMAQAGPEISVLSTKIFTSQVAWGYLLAKTVEGSYELGIQNLEELCDKMDEYLKDHRVHEALKNTAEELSSVNDIFLLGKGQNFLIVKEGMVKLIECTYIHAHAIPAGDLKHYAITLMQPGVQVIVALSEDTAKSDVINAINEVKARGAEVTAISSFEHPSFSHHLAVPELKETSAIMNIIPLQLLAYYIGVELDNDIDKPRNIAKSVTVK
ncbi:MAG: glutamine--fructose-6-phosphate transaminase (isomerizing) [Patescibacteria group bacterium]